MHMVKQQSQGLLVPSLAGKKRAVTETLAHLREQALNQAEVGDSFYDQIPALQQSVCFVRFVLAWAMPSAFLGATALLHNENPGPGVRKGRTR